MVTRGIAFPSGPLPQLSSEEKVFHITCLQVLNQHLSIWEGATLYWGAALGCGKSQDVLLGAGIQASRGLPVLVSPSCKAAEVQSWGVISVGRDIWRSQSRAHSRDRGGFSRPCLRELLSLCRSCTSISPSPRSGSSRKTLPTLWSCSA